MKKVFLAICLTMFSSAFAVTPIVNKMGNSALVSVANDSDKQVVCNGTVTFVLQDLSTQMSFVTLEVPAKSYRSTTALSSSLKMVINVISNVNCF